ncbi:FG-GAP-like repeat-containing protein [Rhodopirellula sp. P2]|uniref:FG-GAP-like repeat-containing protein n=1 Tax=Rhodopirellula sp. P2 TaxID=2127060 RepID=UPI0023684459|nr:FG-GAP-like repeat-containing protein [Rhodopirellula sp. P2]WDQ18021.1 FG-GAP-like repeat-containing protein [Rhodopirellula sp. P2]
MKFGGNLAFLLLILWLPGCRPSDPSVTPQSNTGRDPIETSEKSKQLAGDKSTVASDPTPDPFRQQIAAAVAARDPQSLRSIARQAMLTAGDRPSNYEELGDAWNALGETSDAIEMFETAIEISDLPSADLFEKTGHAYMAQGRAFDTIELMKRCVELHPDDAGRRVSLVGLMISQALERDAMMHLQYLIQRGQAGISELVIASDSSRPQADDRMCEQALKLNPSDLRPQYALTRFDAYKHRWTKVLEQLKPVVKQHPEFTPAWAFLTRAAVEENDTETLQQIALQPFAADYEEHPQVWLARGVWANRNGDPLLAVAAFTEAVRLDPNHHEALTKLTAALASSGNLDLSQKVAVRAGQVNELRDAIDGFLGWRRNSQRLAVVVAEKLQALGRHWEAVVWLRAAFALPQDPAENLQDTYAAARSQLTGKTPWQTFDTKWLPTKSDTQERLAEAAERGWFSRLSEDDRSTLAASNTPKRPAPTRTISDRGYRLIDEAATRGLNHTVGLLRPRPEDGLWLWQSGLGGAGVLDLDLDGWPDLHLTASGGKDGGKDGGTPGKRNSQPNTTARNLAGTFIDVSSASGLADTGFTQGVGIGDFNADGFPDCLIANIGINTLYQNNGDGTFTNVTRAMFDNPDDAMDPEGTAKTQVGTDPRNTWTSSTAIADIDQDGLADLIEVNYCGGPTPYQQRCLDEAVQEYRSCQPISLRAERDRVHRNRGVLMGSALFEDQTDLWFANSDPGRGLGILVGQIDGADGLDIYISNDMTANHFWRFEPASKSLHEQATIRGLAFNHQSAAEASMGIAASDADGDLDLDLFVTHFTDESNTFYEQVHEGLFQDTTESVHLAETSQDMLGFGTQFIDLDGDAIDELVIANGHIDDFSHDGLQYEMPAQLFAIDRNNEWQWVPGSTAGPYFEEPRLGRAMATLDANRDGQTDLVITDLFRPTALLINHTPRVTKSLAVRVVGVSSERDAIGTTVLVTSSSGTQMRQRMAGSGYQCSNEPTLTFAIPNNDSEVTMEVRWPSGSTQNLTVAMPQNDLLLIEPSLVR